jgi:hypothetical protein
VTAEYPLENAVEAFERAAASDMLKVLLAPAGNRQAAERPRPATDLQHKEAV